MSNPEQNKKRGAVVAGAAVAVAAVALAAWALWPAAPADADADVAEVARTVADPNFRDLPRDQRRALAQRMVDERGSAFEGLDDQQRREAFRNTFRERRDQVMDDFFTAETEADRNAVLDDAIDRMRERMEERRQRRAEREASGEAGEDRGERRGPPDGERRGGGDRGADPAQRAKRTEFRAAMRKRMQERGIEPPWGNRGGGRR